MRQKGVFVTEDFSNKRVQGRRKTGRKLAQSDVRVYVYIYKYLVMYFADLLLHKGWNHAHIFLKKTHTKKSKQKYAKR